MYYVALAALLARPSAPIAAQVIDQANLPHGGTFFFSTDWNGQTFKPLAGTSAGAGFLLDNVALSPVSGNLKIELWSAVPTAVGSIKMASGETSFTLGADAESYVDVFWDAIGVTPNTTYFLAMKAFGPSMTLHAIATSTGSYSRGGIYYSFASAPTSQGVGWTNYSTSVYDYNFVEYSSGPPDPDPEPEPSPSPEPASLILLATGLGAVALANARRVRRKR